MAACTVCGPEATGTEGLSWRKEVVVIVLYAATCPVLQGGQDPGRLTSHHRTSQALPYHEHSVSSSVKRAVVPGRQSIAGTELTHSGNSQSSRPKGPDFPHLDSDRPAGHSKAITTIFFKMAHRKPGHPLPPARGSAQLGSLTAPALLLRLRRCTRGWGRNVPGAASFLKCILLSYGSPSSGPYPSYKLNLVVCWGPKRDQRFLP